MNKNFLLTRGSDWNRRRFLRSSATFGAAAALLPAHLFAAAGTQKVEAVVDPSAAGPAIPADFIGLSYETEQLVQPTFFNAANRPLVEAFRSLSPRGVLRLGGNTSDFGFFQAHPGDKAPEHVNTFNVEGEPQANLNYTFTPESIDKLVGFLDATGWSCIYGLNLGTGTPERAATEAAYVTRALGTRLQYLQVGNEPDLYTHHLRATVKWDFDVYFDQFLEFTHAIRARVPGARFGCADGASEQAWIAGVSRRMATAKDAPTLAAVTHHYYAGGPPANPEMTTAFILAAKPNVLETAAIARRTAGDLHIPYRMTEGNTCYRGGKPGVSDVFAASLWAADYLLLLARQGYAGVNLHGGGGGAEVANSLGGTLPGEALLADPSVPHPRPFYTPIATYGGHTFVQPAGTGMQFAAHFAGTQSVPVQFKPGGVNATAYAAIAPGGKRLLAIINKDATQDLDLSAPGMHPTRGLRMTAPSLTAKDVSLKPFTPAEGPMRIPHSSAVLLFEG